MIAATPSTPDPPSATSDKDHTMTIDTMLNAMPGAYRDIGPLLHRLSVWKQACSSLAYVMGGAAPVIAPCAEFGADEGGFLLKGERIAGFAAIDTDRPGAEHHSCIGFSFEGSRIDGVIVPAVRPEGHDPIEGVTLFARWHDNDDEDDGLFLSDIDGPMQINSQGVDLGADTLRIGGVAMPFDEMLWSEFEDGGDGTYHLHVVLSGGRFYHVTGGDFGS